MNDPINVGLTALVILEIVAALAIRAIPGACRALAGKLLEREAYIVAGREAKARQAKAWRERGELERISAL